MAKRLGRWHNGSMGNDITIHHLPEFVSDELKRRARGEGKSFQEYMLGVLADIAANPDAEVLQRQWEEQLLQDRQKEWEARKTGE